MRSQIINGRYSFVAQLNEGRALQKRPTEFRVDQVLQTFDDNKFNFTKASQEEVIFQFGSNASDHTSFVRDQPLQDETNMVLINVSPIEYGHVLLVPRILDKLPQQVRPIPNSGWCVDELVGMARQACRCEKALL